MARKDTPAVTPFTEVDKLKAPIGTVTYVPWSETTSWALSGWTTQGLSVGHAMMRKAR